MPFWKRRAGNGACRRPARGGRCRQIAQLSDPPRAPCSKLQSGRCSPESKSCTHKDILQSQSKGKETSQSESNFSREKGRRAIPRFAPGTIQVEPWASDDCIKQRNTQSSSSVSKSSVDTTLCVSTTSCNCDPVARLTLRSLSCLPSSASPPSRPPPPEHISSAGVDEVVGFKTEGSTVGTFVSKPTD